MLKRILISLFLLIIISLISLYFWASSANLDKESYYQILEFKPAKKLAQSDTISLMTYNIGYLSGMTNNQAMHREKKLFDDNLLISEKLISDSRIDLIAFQEIDFNADRSYNVNQFSRIAKDLEFPYGAKAINWDKKHLPFPYFPIKHQFGKTISGQAILSRYPIFRQEVFTLEKPENAPFWYNQFYLDRLVQICEINLGSPFYLINVHLEAFDQKTREKQAKAMIEKIAPIIEKYPSILTGDFNSPIPMKGESTISDILNKLNLQEAVADSLYAKSNIATFPADKPTQKIDHIFFDPKRIELVSWEIPKLNFEASDHRAILMRFKLKEKL